MEVAVCDGLQGWEQKHRWHSKGPPPCRKVVVLSNDWWCPEYLDFWRMKYRQYAIDDGIPLKCVIAAAEPVNDAWRYDENEVPWERIHLDHQDIFSTWRAYQAKVEEHDDEAKRLADARANAVRQLQKQMPEGIELHYTEEDEFGRVSEITNPELLYVSLRVRDMKVLMDHMKTLAGAVLAPHPDVGWPVGCSCDAGDEEHHTSCPVWLARGYYKEEE
jgi:hypothetical protein